eukprot:gnl/TRDRNA2_/TRDRNA2_129966_c1_seq2.p1 gnl/TRDRNA2_/TRDRNA2_129966_c1~~gnl/TRDRNA2_/TRDRNA2_129966_c1_seq2.p1  ORF type:complete len:250 (+),score=66.48 gnl/TRDRNA2_/TRDRNA2_129966_c1_seq2:49-798(+)
MFGSAGWPEQQPAKGSGGDSETECKLFLGGLSPDIQSEDIRNHFAQYGNVTDAVAMYKDGKHRGFGFVTFDNAQIAEMAANMPQTINGRTVDVKRCVAKGAAPPPVGKAAQQQYKQESKIFVGGLTLTTTNEMLQQHFGQYGNLIDSVVMVTPEGKPRGFGFVTYDNPQTAEIVLGQQQMLDGKALDCKAAVKDQSKGGGKWGGGGKGGGGMDDSMFQMFGMMMEMMGGKMGGKGGGGFGGKGGWGKPY